MIYALLYIHICTIQGQQWVELNVFFALSCSCKTKGHFST